MKGPRLAGTQKNTDCPSASIAGNRTRNHVLAGQEGTKFKQSFDWVLLFFGGIVGPLSQSCLRNIRTHLYNLPDAAKIIGHKHYAFALGTL